MTPIPVHLHSWRRALLGVLLPLCFVAQQVWVPVHLALCEHLREHADGTHEAIVIEADHGAREHTHVHEGEDRDSDEGPHEPHPADDHDDEVTELAVPSHAGHAALALIPVERARDNHLLRSLACAAPVVADPRAPPLRFAAPPRGPPLSI